MTLFINGVAAPVENALHCWGDLVTDLDRRLAASQSMVTAVRLDGVEEPAFRDPEVCSRRLTDIECIDVETGEPEALARQCLTDAVAGLAGLRVMAREAADHFRSDQIAQGRKGLEHVSQGLVTVLQIVAAAGLALRRELERADAGGRTVRTLSSEMDQAIRELVTGQQNEDWILVADVLEHDLDPMLNGWQSVLTQVAAA